MVILDNPLAPPQWPSTWRCSNPHAPIAGRAARGSDPPQPGPRGSQGDRPLGSKNGGISTGKIAKLWTKWWISMEELGNSGAKIWKNMGTMGHKHGKHLENMGKLMI